MNLTLTRSQLEGWACIFGLTLIASESDEDLRNRLKQTWSKPQVRRDQCTKLSFDLENLMNELGYHNMEAHIAIHAAVYWISNKGMTNKYPVNIYPLDETLTHLKKFAQYPAIAAAIEELSK